MFSSFVKATHVVEEGKREMRREGDSGSGESMQIIGDSVFCLRFLFFGCILAILYSI